MTEGYRNTKPIKRLCEICSIFGRRNRIDTTYNKWYMKYRLQVRVYEKTLYLCDDCYIHVVKSIWWHGLFPGLEMMSERGSPHPATRMVLG